MSSYRLYPHGKYIALDEKLAAGGEGFVWKTDQPGVLAKVYKNPPSTFQINKLTALIDNPPVDPNRQLNHISFAWPISLLEDDKGLIVGFVMPVIDSGRELLHICNPRSRRKRRLRADWHFLHVVAMNLSNLIECIHQAGYIIGDIKLQNILINAQGLPSVIDVDSFQVHDSNSGQTFRCQVGSEGFTPPELFGKEFTTIDQKPEQDYFRLGIVIYYLLFGEHPFQGSWTGSGEAPEKDRLVEQGMWPFAPPGRSKIASSKRTIPLGILSPNVENAFLRCFNDGHRNPRRRPTAKDWYDELHSAIHGLEQCSANNDHWNSISSSDYLRHQRCYWCERANKLNYDVFPFEPSYAKLENFLRTNNWLQADLETKWLLHQITGRQKQYWLDQSAILSKKHLPIKVLQFIDNLWKQASDGRFGYSIQANIYQQTGNIPGEFNYMSYRNFGQTVGWLKGGSWINYNHLNFSLSAPKGHLPFCESGFICLISHISSRFLETSP